MAWSSGRSTCGLNHPSIEVVMKLDAIRKMRMPGPRARAMKVRTSLALNREPMIFCRRSNESFTRVRKSRGRRTRFGLHRGAYDLRPPLERELHQVAEEQDEQQQEDDQVQVEEEEDDEVGGEGDLGRADAHLEDGGHHQEDEDPGDDEQGPLAPSP